MCFARDAICSIRKRLNKVATRPPPHTPLTCVTQTPRVNTAGVRPGSAPARRWRRSSPAPRPRAQTTNGLITRGRSRKWAQSRRSLSRAPRVRSVPGRHKGGRRRWPAPGGIFFVPRPTLDGPRRSSQGTTSAPAEPSPPLWSQVLLIPDRSVTGGTRVSRSTFMRGRSPGPELIGWVKAALGVVYCSDFGRFRGITYCL